MNTRLKVTPSRPGSARVEFFACREDVEAMLAKGYNARMVYEAMKEQGRVSCSYSAFCDYVRGGGKRLHSKKNRKLSPVMPPVKPGGPRIIGAEKSNACPDPRNMRIEDAI